MSLTTAPEIRAHVARAARTVSPTWPLTSFIAVNPLAGHERRPIDELTTASGESPTRPEADYLAAHATGRIPEAAVREALHDYLPEVAAMGRLTSAGRAATGIDIALCALQNPPGGPTTPGAPADDVGTDIDQYLSALLARLYSDPVWAPPGSGTLYERFRQVAAHDRAMPRDARRRLADLPDTPEDAIAAALRGAHSTAEDVEAAVTAQLRALPGWVSHLAWRASRADDASLTDFVAMRLSLLRALNRSELPSAHTRLPSIDVDPEWVARVSELCFGGPAGRAHVLHVLAFLDAPARRMVWQTAAECAYRTELFGRLADATGEPGEPADVQVMFCIDVRSEGLRRHLERDPGVRTFGFAGFFGVPLRHTPLLAQAPREQYPALLSAGYPSGEDAADAAGLEIARRQSTAEGAADRLRKRVAGAPASAFAWAEVSGWGGLLTGLVWPLRRLRHRADVATVVDVCRRLPLDQRAAIAESVLRMTGLTRFAPLVVLAGHASSTVNNLYRAALDCGACGGNAGAVNARAATAIFNDPEVRARLAERGLQIPDTTWFVAAEHDTTTDALRVLDRHLIPAHQLDAVARLEAIAAAAGDRLTRERADALPGAGPRTSLRKIRRRAGDWAEMYPELGLAGNAALIIGPRAMTRGADLQRRVFLHDYDPSSDPDGAGLGNIMTAPLIVAQWINAQYYFSTIQPERYGAGDKTLHNPVGDLGVLAGHTGDLRTGLPWQSVAAGTELLHTPLRLSVLIQAPLDRIGHIVAATDALRELLDGDWISLHARSTAQDPWMRYTRYGFTPVRPSATGLTCDERTLA